MLHTKGSLEVDVLKSDREFAALEEEWEELLQQAPLATPFQSWAWLYSWWEHYGKDYELELVAVRDRGGLLVGILPFMLDRRWRFARLLFIGTGLTDYLDILVREGWEAQVATAGVEALRRMNLWTMVDLHEISSEAAALSLCRRWPGPRLYILQKAWQGWQLGYPVIEVKPWDELLMSVSTRLRKNARRSLRQAGEDGVRCRLARPEEAEHAARRLIALHQEMWQGRGIDQEHLSDRFGCHVVAAAKRLTVSGAGGIYEFWRNGKVVASHFLLFGRDFVADYLVGVKQEALQRYQMYSLYM